MLESLFDKVAVLQPSNFIKERLQHRCFPLNITKFLKTPILKNSERLLLIIVISSQESNQMQRCFETLVQVFSVNFVKFLITRFFTEILRWLLLSGPTLHKEITCEMVAYG